MRRLTAFLSMILLLITTQLYAGTYSGGKASSGDPCGITGKSDLKELSGPSADSPSDFIQSTGIRQTAETKDIVTDEKHPKVLLVSSRVDHADMLAAAAAEDVLVVRYDPKPTDLDGLNTKIKKSLNGRTAASVCIAAHDYGDNKFYLTASETISLGSTLSSAAQRAFWDTMGKMIVINGRIDLLSCNLASGDNGALLVSSLEKAAGVNCAASTNPTGNPRAGGDWILETDGIDVANEYFNRERLGTYPGLLWNDEKKITAAADASWFAYFGRSVAISGDYAIVGAEYEDDGEYTAAGAAYIFHNVDGTWTRQAKFTGEASANYFGYSVAISDSYAIVGAPGYDLSSTDMGAVYTYRNDSGEWKSAGILRPGRKNERVGESIAISDGYIIIGIERATYGALYGGKALIYARNDSGSSWVQKCLPLTASDQEDYDVFGSSVAISGDYAIVGAEREDTGGENAGAAYIFHNDDGDWTEWTEKAILKASTPAAGSYFGSSVAISGDNAIVGAQREATGTIRDTGAAYIFHNENEDWTEKVKFKTLNPVTNDYVGESVAISGDYAIVGAQRQDDSRGAAYIFHNGDGEWTKQTELTASDSAEGDNFGSSVAISGGYAIVGAKYEDTGRTNAGAAYIFYDPAAAAVATVTTQTVSSIASTTATGNGNITDPGSSNPTAHGVCWNIGGTPTIGDSHTDEGAADSTGAFTSAMTGLSANMTYYVRAYATNANGIAYGDQVTFTAISPGNWSDDFTGGASLNWESVDTGTSSTVEEINERLELSTGSSFGAAHVSVFVEDADVADAIITARVLEVVPNGYNAHLLLRYNASGADSGYLFGITDTGTVYLGKRTNGITTTLVEKSGVAVGLDNMDCHLKMAVIGNKLFGKVWDGDSEPCAWLIEASDTDFSSGDAGMGVSVPGIGTSMAAFDDVRMTTDLSDFYQNSGACGGSTIPGNGSAAATAGDSSVTIVSDHLQAHAASITEVSDTPDNPERGLFSGNLIDKSLDISCSLNNGDFTAVVKLHYTDEQIAGINEMDLRLYYYDETAEAWLLAVDDNTTGSIIWRGNSAPTATLGDHGVDADNNIVWAVVDHFTDFGAGGIGTGGWVLQDSPASGNVSTMLQGDSSQTEDSVAMGAGATLIWVAGAPATSDTTFNNPFGGQLLFSSVTTGGNFTVDIGSYNTGTLTFTSGISGTVALSVGTTLYDMDALGTFGAGSFPVNAGQFLALQIINTTVNPHTLLTGGLRSWLNATGTSDPYPTLITLTSFNAANALSGMELTWHTESEVDNAGFYIWRSTTREGVYERITAGPIPAEGSETVAVTYTYTDETATAGQLYYYQLEDISDTGVSTLHGPIAVNAPGDINGDNAVDLADSICALKVMAGIYTGPLNPPSFVTGSSRVGLADALYPMQVKSGMRSPDDGASANQ